MIALLPKGFQCDVLILFFECFIYLCFLIWIGGFFTVFGSADGLNYVNLRASHQNYKSLISTKNFGASYKHFSRVFRWISRSDKSFCHQKSRVPRNADKPLLELPKYFLSYGNWKEISCKENFLFVLSIFLIMNVSQEIDSFRMCYYT